MFITIYPGLVICPFLTYVPDIETGVYLEWIEDFNKEYVEYMFSERLTPMQPGFNVLVDGPLRKLYCTINDVPFDEDLFEKATKRQTKAIFMEEFIIHIGKHEANEYEEKKHLNSLPEINASGTGCKNAKRGIQS